MLETLLKPNTGASLSGCVRWTQPMDGVRVCDFDDQADEQHEHG